MFYVVQPGDSLDLISLRLGLPSLRIMHANKLLSPYISSGQILYIPEMVYRTPTYTVQSGDSLYSIAQKFGTTVEELMKVNNLTSTTLMIGQQLLISAGGGTETPQSSGIITTKIQHSFVSGENIPVWKLRGKDGFFFTSKFAIDVDGAYRAYNPQNTGLADLSQAGRPGNWWALVTHNGKPNGYPVTQKHGDPAEGYYISMTTLYDCEKLKENPFDPTAFVDSETIPYFVLPGNQKMGATLGDFAMVANLTNGRIAYAYFADLGPRGKIGEGSIALAKALGLKYNPPKTGGTLKKELFYLVFPNSGAGPCKKRSIEEINENGERLFNQWGGIKQMQAVI